MESRDLLVDFRFNDQGTRQKVHGWFHGTAWKAAHKRCEAFIDRISGGETELARLWGIFSALSHPTVTACRNSTALTVSWVTRRTEDFTAMMEAKVADYLVSLSTLIIAVTFDFPGWIELGCDLGRMPSIEPFRVHVKQTVLPILERNKDASVPRV
ncbi:MAG TPA: hypothetical protein VES66_04050 [Terriglobales bacterium]|nr:hypothetical protein [Terriglobales bacterium]